MRLYLLLLVVLAAFAFAPHVYSADGVKLEISVRPNEPTNFQPTDESKSRALITFKALELEPGVDALVRLRVSHVEGRGVINTGYPHLEGKLVFAGDIPMRNGIASLEYLFPVRGNYLVEAELLRLPGITLIGRGDLMVHVTEPFFEIRNSIILLLLLFVFGLFLGRVYGSALRGVSP